ncbi:hypothetical protein QBE54_02560 [Thermatribacter velox]|uniref:Uncharacterized protein n=1 Tax=Thermatribacter velox TaxID=3039681 RepID=A0ABZ2YCA4_9BACT
MRTLLFRILTIWVLLTLVVLLSGCRVGLGVVAEVRLGVIYFASSDATTYGELYLDGSRAGWLEPFGVISEVTTLDFPHQVDLHCGFCGEVHTWVFEPPFHAGETLELSVTH